MPTVLANVRAVKQLLFNLIGNAIKFANPSTVVRVQMQHEGAGVTLSSATGGPASPPRSSPRSSIRSRASTTAAPRRKAPASDCRSSKRLVLAMGGRIGVRSDVGIGTTFTVTLPSDGQPDLTDADDTGFGMLDTLAPSQRMARGNVLYIEDEPVNALLMEAIFGTLPEGGPTLTVRATGTDGLREAARLIPDLILLDMNLSDLDGLAIMRMLGDDPRTASIPVIVVSADALPPADPQGA